MVIVTKFDGLHKPLYWSLVVAREVSYIKINGITSIVLQTCQVFNSADHQFGCFIIKISDKKEMENECKIFLFIEQSSAHHKL